MPKHPPVVAYATRTYSRLLNCYPAPYQERYGEDIRATFTDQALDYFQAGGSVAVIGLLFYSLLDGAVQAASEHLQTIRNPEKPMTPNAFRGFRLFFWVAFAAAFFTSFLNVGSVNVPAVIAGIFLLGIIPFLLWATRKPVLALAAFAFAAITSWTLAPILEQVANYLAAGFMRHFLPQSGTIPMGIGVAEVFAGALPALLIGLAVVQEIERPRFGQVRTTALRFAGVLLLTLSLIFWISILVTHAHTTPLLITGPYYGNLWHTDFINWLLEIALPLGVVVGALEIGRKR